ncbi:MAG: hypothetical protein ACTHOH_03545 [Lysobacteraceae bacterium]
MRARGIVFPDRLFASLMLLNLVFAAGPAFAAGPSPCARLAQALEGVGDAGTTACHEGKALKRLHATLPRGLRVVAARGLSVDDDLGYRELDPRSERIDLDRADALGIDGALLLQGRLTLQGRVRYEPNPGWELAFLPDRRSSAPAATRTPAMRALERIVLDRPDGTLALAPPPELADATCWEASAELRIDDVLLLIDDSELAGARALSPRLSRVRDFRACDAPP